MKFFHLLCAILLALLPVAPNAQEVRILVPVFSGDERLGKTVANLLRLQISQTFQVAGTNTTGVMILRERPLAAPEHGQAQAAGLELGALSHIVLWGQAYYYSDGVVLETHLSITDWITEGRSLRPEIWQLAIAGTDLALRSELPREVYELPNKVVTLEAARHYADFDGLVIYRDRAFTQPIGQFRNVYRAHRYWDDAAEITSNGVTGYVPLPHLAAARSETVDFVAGYIRLLRGDWPGARERFQRIYSAEDMPSEAELDTRLFLGLIEEKGGRSGIRYFDEAIRLNPYDRAASSYLLMGRLAQVQRSIGAARVDAIGKLEADIERYRPLFPEDSQWLAMLVRIQQHYARSQ